ncbi:MAG: hypothetical protein FWD66_00925 [Paludibacter sp.]|nr:hypothetical protein [Paludibacter sp.]
MKTILTILMSICAICAFAMAIDNTFRHDNPYQPVLITLLWWALPIACIGMAIFVSKEKEKEEPNN